MPRYRRYKILAAACAPAVLFGCQGESARTPAQVFTINEVASTKESRFLTQPLITHIYTADPAAHLFAARIYIYPSHDIESTTAGNDEGGQFDMRDYHVLSMDSMGGQVIDHGVALDLDDVPWAKRQFWAPDAAENSGKYYLYFPAKDEQNVFRLGVAVADTPAGPFKAEARPMDGSYSIDPAVFQDGDKYYLYFGGLRGGQLQRWASGKYTTEDVFPANDEPALTAKVAVLSKDMLSFAEKPRDVVIIDENGRPVRAGDAARRFFEGAWVHTYKGKYYFSYSTGDTHFIAYAIGDSPYGPFKYTGKVLEPVLGWTTQHSIIEVGAKWYLFYHDSQLSKGKTNLRNIKVTELTHREDGTIETIDPYVE